MLDEKNNLRGPPIKLTVVVPVFNEVENVGPLIGEIRTALENNISYEMVFVDDCSDDGTFDKLILYKILSINCEYD